MDVQVGVASTKLAAILEMRSFEKESETWNVSLSEYSDDLGLKEVAGFGFVDRESTLKTGSATAD